MWFHKKLKTGFSSSRQVVASVLSSVVAAIHVRVESLLARVSQLELALANDGKVEQSTSARRAPLGTARGMGRPSSIVMLAQLKSQRRHCQAMVAQLLALAGGTLVK